MVEISLTEEKVSITIPTIMNAIAVIFLISILSMCFLTRSKNKNVACRLGSASATSVWSSKNRTAGGPVKGKIIELQKTLDKYYILRG